MSAKWFDLRFEESMSKTRFDCQVCGRSMWFPPSKAGKYLTCGGICAAERIEQIKKARERSCETCGKLFFPRSTQISSGGGRYCCVACAEPTRAAGRTLEVSRKRGEARRVAYRDGRIRPLIGDKNPRWKGGRTAYQERQKLKDPEERRRKRREYLRANPEKAREWTKKRRGSSRAGYREEPSSELGKRSDGSARPASVMSATHSTKTTSSHSQLAEGTSHQTSSYFARNATPKRAQGTRATSCV